MMIPDDSPDERKAADCGERRQAHVEEEHASREAGCE